jgi:hypothetical protein
MNVIDCIGCIAEKIGNTISEIDEKPIVNLNNY